MVSEARGFQVMYELVQMGESTYYVNSPTKVGIYVTAEGKAHLIDSGNDKEAAKKIKAIIDSKGWSLESIINTHSNADHIGGNEYLQGKTNCRVLVPPVESAFTSHPFLESAFLYGGCPMKALRNKFLMARPSLPEKTFNLPDGLDMVELPGHFFQMIGIRTPDNVYFIADSIFSANVLSKYHVFFVYDVDAFLETLDRLEAIEARYFVPSHAEATEDIRPLAKANRDKVFEIIDVIMKYSVNGSTFEELLKSICDHYRLTLDANQYVLVGSTLRSYLSYLSDIGRLEYRFDDNKMVWKTI